MSFLSQLNEDFFDFIKENQKKDIYKLILKNKNLSRDPLFEFKICQIQCRQKTRRKLSHFLKNDAFLFPTALSAEQSTNQVVAAYHARLVGHGKSIIDMTAGLGIDAMTMAMFGNHVTAIEIDKFKSEILSYNSQILNIKNLTVVNANSIEFLKSDFGFKSDVIFIDPARREGEKRTYAFSDCQPDVVSNLEIMKLKAGKLLIKASPMLDITKILKEFDSINEIHIVCVNGECKEILIIIDLELCPLKKDHKDIFNKVKIIVVDINNSEDNIGLNNEIIFKSRFECFNNEFGTTNTYAKNNDLVIGNFLYDPNAGIQKLNISSKVITEFPNLKKLAPNSNLYISSIYYNKFPGRICRIEDIPDKKKQKLIKNQKKDIVCRNYPITPDLLKKKLNLESDGRGHFLYATRFGLDAKPILMSCVSVLD